MAEINNGESAVAPAGVIAGLPERGAMLTMNDPDVSVLCHLQKRVLCSAIRFAKSTA